MIIFIPLWAVILITIANLIIDFLVIKRVVLWLKRRKSKNQSVSE